METTACLLRKPETQFQLLSSKTLPRRSCHSKQATDEFISNMLLKSTEKNDNDLIIPPQQNAPRPTTLPTRGAMNRTRKTDVELSAQLAREEMDANSNPLQQRGCDNMSPCESPSYVTNFSSYKFPEQNMPTPELDLNCLPVPPKEGKKHIQTNPKRHVRKYPLIIPANGVQRTLNKVMAEEEKQSLLINSANSLSGMQVATDLTANCVPTIKPFNIMNNNGTQQTANTSADYENTINAAGPKDSSSNRRQLPAAATQEERTYQNVSSISAGLDDTASLQFETILEADLNNDPALQSPDVTDGFYNFSIHKDLNSQAQQQKSDAVVGLNNKDNNDLTNFKSTTNVVVKENICAAVKSEDIQQISTKLAEASSSSSSAATLHTTSTEKSHKTKPKSLRAENELAGNALFQKIKESVDKSMIKPSTDDSCLQRDFKSRQLTEAELFSAAVNRLTDSNSVSCEDLLEFSDKKPKGRERGADSDEVRIMMKVLGKDVS